MTGTSTRDLESLLARVDLLMLDFDGPICSVFAGLPAPTVAERLKRSLAAFSSEAPAELQYDSDPLSIYRRSAVYGPHAVEAIYQDLESAEIEAVCSAVPTPGGGEAIAAAKWAGLPVAIVSNNAAAAIQAYLTARGLAPTVDHVAARRTPSPHLMKPNPAYLIEAATAVGVPLARSAMVGDSEADMEAARLAGAVAVGYANKPGKRHRLSRAGATTVIDDMLDLATALARPTRRNR